MHRKSSQVAVLTLLSLPVAARAGTVEDIQEAIRLIRAAQDEEAIQVVTRALDRDGVTRLQHVELYQLLGIARMNLLDKDGARLAFLHALRDAPRAELPLMAPPKTQELFQKVRRELQKNPAPPENLADSPHEPPPEPATPEAQVRIDTPPLAPPVYEAPPVDRAPAAEPPEVQTRPYRPGLRIGGICVAASGAVIALFGGVAIFEGQLSYAQAASETDPFLRSSDRDAGAFFDAFGIGVAALGVIAAGAGIVMVVMSGSSSAVSVSPTPGGVSVVARF